MEGEGGFTYPSIIIINNSRRYSPSSMATKGKVLVAISGGVDSAVATLLLKRKGYKVEGVFMQNWDARIEQPSQQCCSIDKDYSDAVKVASILDIPLKRVNFVREYWQNVFSNLIDGYKKGLTPNPDLMCNKEIKFGSLLKWAKTHDFDLLATGHYARIISQEGRLWIGQAVNIEKDQSYFLANVTESSLDSIIFPLGDIPSKDHVKFMALQNGLGFLLEKPESMGICFVGKRQSFSQFLSDFVEGRPGHIIQQETGKILGTHNGVELYTLGQHLAIGGMPARMFVVEKRQKEAQLYVSSNRYYHLLPLKDYYYVLTNNFID